MSDPNEPGQPDGPQPPAHTPEPDNSSAWAWVVGLVVVFYLFSGSGKKQGHEPTRESTYVPPVAAYQPPPQPRPQPRSQTYSQPVFHGYACTQDCSGHEAGYEWAEDHDIDDPDDCGGNSQSFIEGCMAYAEEQQYGYSSYDADEEEEDGEEDDEDEDEDRNR